MHRILSSGDTTFIPKTALQNGTPKSNGIVEQTNTVVTDIFVPAVKVG